MVVAQKVDKDLMRKSNMKLLLSVILEAREISKAQAAVATRMSTVSVGRMSEELIELGLVREKDWGGQTAVGRPPKVLSLAADKLCSCGVFLEREFLHLGLVDPYGALRNRASYPVPEMEFTPELVLPWMAAHIGRYLGTHTGTGLLNTVGLVVPGIVDIDRGEVQFSAHFRWRSVQVTDFLHAHLPAYVFLLENDSKAVAIAEHSFGASSSCKNMVVLSLGSGIGAAVILNGEIYRGKDNMAGEIGHIMLNPAGKICECGQVGCLQTNLAQRAILTEARSVYPGITMPGLVEHFQRGDPFAVALIGRVVDYTSIAINLLANTYAPETILVCGGLLRQNPIFQRLISENYRSKLNDYMQDSFDLRFETFGLDGHLIGGGALAFRRTLDAMLQ